MGKTVKVSKKVETPKTGTVKKSLEVDIPDLLTFLQAGAHFGHKSSAWNPKMKKYVYDTRNGIHIIDIVKSRKLLEKALEQLNSEVDRGNVLIVGTKGQAAGIIEKVAQEIGAFYITKRWPGGLFTNFDAIKSSVQNLVKMEEQLASGEGHLVKKEVLIIQRDVDRLNKIYEGIKFMDELPKFVIVIDSKVEKNAIREARIAKVPIIALIDTNCDPTLVDYPIPANDDSIKSINLFVDLFAEVIKKGKKSESLVALRKNHKANLENLKAEYEKEKERQVRMEEDERARMKALRDRKVTEREGGVVRVVKRDKNIDEDYVAAEAIKAESVSTKIEDLGLSTRVQKALLNGKVLTLEELKEMNETDLLKISGIGQKAVEEIMKVIK